MSEQENNLLNEETPDSIDHMVNDDDDVITLVTDDGEEVDFIEVAGIAYRGNFYAILQPIKLIEGMDADEALIFKVTRGKNGEDNFEIELDDSILEAVFNEYQKTLDASTEGK